MFEHKPYIWCSCHMCRGRRSRGQPHRRTHMRSMHWLVSCTVCTKKQKLSPAILHLAGVSSARRMHRLRAAQCRCASAQSSRCQLDCTFDCDNYLDQFISQTGIYPLQARCWLRGTRRCTPKRCSCWPGRRHDGRRRRRGRAAARNPAGVRLCLWVSSTALHAEQ